MQPTFSVSEFTLWHYTLEQDLEILRTAGVEAMELCERKLSQDPVQAAEQLHMVTEAGITVTSIQPRVHALFPDSMAPMEHEPTERMRKYERSLELMARFFPGVPLVAITGNAPNHNYRHAFEIAQAVYPQLADIAKNYGMRIMFEPLSPFLMNNDTFICSLDDALRLIEHVNRPNFGLMVDVWHIWHEPNIAARITKLRDVIFGVHISDWPSAYPRCPADRLLPGDGRIDLRLLLAAIEGSGYQGAYCLEVFSADELPDSLWRHDPVKLIRRAKNQFYALWEARHAQR